MAKHKIAPREILKRQGNFWQEGIPLAEKDQELLKIIKDRAVMLGHTPRVSEVPEAGKIKGRFRCWKDALRAAELLPKRVK